ncbi:ArsR/SmtB family transcription factor [Nanoarchaeota archaeon]
MNVPCYDRFFSNLANRSRFEIIVALRNGPLSVSELVEKTGKEQSAVSHNLQKMAHCKILNVEQKGKQRVYSLNKETIVPILEIVEKHVKTCCIGGKIKLQENKTEKNLKSK